MKCTTKGQKQISGAKMVKVLEAIAHDHEVVLLEQYEEQLTGQFFADFVRENFAGWRPQSEFFETEECYA